ncbi:MAG: phosphoheptose isomerase, partial [Clostridia bacterium]|nr:phosphoheptose isomerase [Clostridia bacterium]
MSFMFNPYPYDDPNAFNAIDSKGIDTKSIVNGNAAVAESLADLAVKGLAKRKTVIFGMDGYATAPIDQVATLVAQQLNLRGVKCTILNVEDIYKDEEVLDMMIEEDCLHMDREQDPVL